LENSVFLDKEIILRNSDSFLINKPVRTVASFFNGLPEGDVNTNYAISMWVYISSNEKRHETDIFNYSNHPRLTYFNNMDNTKEEQNKIIVYFTNTNDTVSHTISVEQQKWNFIVVNYNDNGICDVYLNGSLVKSVDVGVSRPTYHISDNVVVGSDKGLYGSISNVGYHKTPLTPSQISTTYNLLMFKNPPIY
jgi:hypothetical protein